MLKIKDLYNPLLEGRQYNGFIKAANIMQHIKGTWVTKLDLDDLDTYILNRLSDKPVRSLFDRVATSSYFNISRILSTYSYHIDTLYDTTTLEYDPIENYNRTEVHSGTDTTKHGKQEGSSTIGSSTDSQSYGETSVSNVYAKDKTTNVYGETTDSSTSTTDVSAFDITDGHYADDNKTTTANTSLAHTDTSERDGRTDTSTQDAHTDTLTRGSRTDSTTAQAYDDELVHGESIHTYGNAGVTTTQQMIREERELVMNIYEEIADIVASEICMMIWESDEECY